jgi:hypothetical protein
MDLRQIIVHFGKGIVSRLFDVFVLLNLLDPMPNLFYSLGLEVVFSNVTTVCSSID